MQNTIDKTSPRSPNPVDTHVGARLRLRRQVLKMSQEKLGEALGVTFQQVQKYERGANRIGASRLWKISQVLEIPVAFFFEGLEDGLFMEDPDIYRDTELLVGFINSADGVSMAKAMVKIPPLKRRKLLELARVMAGESTGELLPLT